MKPWVGLVCVVALAGCSDNPAPTWEPLPGLENVSVFDLQLDPSGHPVISTSAQLWRFSDALGRWGQVGLDGRPEQYIPNSFAVASSGVIYAIGAGTIFM